MVLKAQTTAPVGVCQALSSAIVESHERSPYKEQKVPLVQMSHLMAPGVGRAWDSLITM